jgi:hypothetical protein
VEPAVDTFNKVITFTREHCIRDAARRRICT